jgi:uncharacterized membrane protein YozB (DUF420 family)
MAMDRAELRPVHGHGGHHADEHIDHQGNANLAVWLALSAVTFMSATFVATNVYLKVWTPSKFATHLSGLLQDLPYWVTVFLVLSGLSVVTAGALFLRDKWRAFNGVLAVTTVLYTVVLVLQFRLMLWFAGYNAQVATIYAPTAIIEFLLILVGVALLAVAGWYASYADKTKINQFFPVAMNVWIYSVLFGIAVLFMENVITVGQFAAWCGQHI